jgi:hypothetical protein
MTDWATDASLVSALQAPFEACSAWQRFGIIAASVILLAVVSHLMKADTKSMKQRGSGIVPFERAGSDQRARQILTGWGATGRASAKRDLLLDVPLIVVYSVGLATMLSAAAHSLSATSWPWVGSVDRALAWAPIIAGTLDLIEDVCLWLVIARFESAVPKPVSPWRAVARLCATAKFVALIVGAAWLLLVVAPMLIPR